MLFRRKRTKPPEPTVIPLEPVDHSLAEAALHSAVDAQRAAQEQATEAREVVQDLRRVNLRNGFAPAIRDSFNRTYGGAV